MKGNGETSLSTLICLSSGKRSTLKEKYLPLSKYFPFGIDPFLEGSFVYMKANKKS